MYNANLDLNLETGYADKQYSLEKTKVWKKNIPIFYLHSNNYLNVVRKEAIIYSNVHLNDVS